MGEFSRLVTPGLILLLAAGCSMVNPRIGQLETFKRQAQAGNWSAIAESPVSCEAGSDGCAQLHRIRGDACLRRAAAGPDSALAPGYDCALSEYAAAIRSQAVHPDAQVDPVQLRAGELDALQRRRDCARSAAEAAPYNARLQQESASLAASAPSEPAGYYYLADSLLSQGLAETAPQACRTLDRAASALDEAAAHPGGYGDAIAQRRRDLASGRATQCRPLAPS